MLVDNGRSRIVANESFRESLKCIRCGACLNTCPVYRRSGGFSYRSTIPGPIGSVLGPMRDAREHYSLPYACSLCGSCTDVCPVRVPLHHQLLAWRGKIAQQLLAIQQENLGIDYVNKRNDLVNAVTLEDAKRVAKRLIQPDALTISIVGRPEGIPLKTGETPG